MIIAFLQMTVIPGLLIQQILFPEVRLRYKLINSLPVSFIINYMVVITAFSLGIISRPLVLGFVFLEILAVFYLYLKAPSQLRIPSLVEKGKNFYTELQVHPGLFKVAALMGALLLFIFFDNMGGVFKNWDAVFSWNRWALDWYRGVWPIGTAHYPQMYPVNWAMSYYVMGYDFQFVPKLSMSLSAILLFLTPIVFFKNYKSTNQSFVFSILLTAVMYSFLKIYLNDGYVDGPVSIWGFLCFSNLLYSFKKDENQNYFYFVALLLLAFVPLVKQAGWLLYIPFFVLLFKENSLNKINREALLSFFLFLMFTVGFYAYTEFHIRSGSNHSEVPFVTGGIYNGRAIFERWEAALQILVKNISLGFVLLLAVLSFFGALFRKAESKFIFGYWVAYFFIWMSFYSYDQRNLVMCIPFILFYFHRIYFSELKIESTRLKIINKLGYVAIAVIVLIGLTKVKFEKLVEIQDQKTILVGNKEVNEYLYKYYSEEKNRPYPGITGDYPMIVNLRWVRPYFLHDNMNKSDSVETFMANSDFRFLAIYDLATVEVREKLNKEAEAGHLLERVRSKQAVLYEKSN